MSSMSQPERIVTTELPGPGLVGHLLEEPLLSTTSGPYLWRVVDRTDRSGPYYTSYTSGQDLTLTTWTGLAQYATASTPTLFDSVLQTSSPSPGSAGAGPSGSQSAGAGTPSGAAGLSAGIPKMGGWLMSGLLGWALL